jgi:hypothetical protein
MQLWLQLTYSPKLTNHLLTFCESTTAHKHLFAYTTALSYPDLWLWCLATTAQKSLVQQDLAHLSPGPTVDPANWSINSPSLWSTDSSSMGTKRSPPRLRGSWIGNDRNPGYGAASLSGKHLCRHALISPAHTSRKHNASKVWGWSLSLAWNLCVSP